VALMRCSKNLASLDGVEDAALMMGTPANRQIMTDAGLLSAEGEAAAAGDLVIGIRAEDHGAADRALAAAEAFLERPAGTPGVADTWQPKTLRAGQKALPDANLALISVPGDYAAAEARKALNRGLDVMIFSDNVPIEAEIALKQQGREAGRLVMGPDCGTAIISGVPLAFANEVPRGDIGIVGASGTGIQEISSLIARGKKGVSHAIGVGGRDLKAEVGGITTLMALDMLDADPATRHVVVVSKPPASTVAARIAARIGESEKTFTVCFLGGEPIDLPANAKSARTLRDAARLALGQPPLDDGAGLARASDDLAAVRGRTEIRGLFTGGTLCAEAQVIMQGAGLAVASNVPISGVTSLDVELVDRHRLIDLGDDRYTQGRPHPMIDPAVRDHPLQEALADPKVGVVLLDVVLGHGGHHDPGGHLADTLAALSAEGRLIVASVTGTDDDPQTRARQVDKLQRVGVKVAPSNAEAVTMAIDGLSRRP
ncbi:MAG: acyl-CoA synthetase FdrA, partial [Alphaproteobacteria bacterium]|nr:acyl-CoA synthetase FdrA [Alphaproteobacteria bacterium]